MKMFDSLEDNLVATLSINELISKLYRGSDRDFKIAALIEKARYVPANTKYDKSEYDSGFDDGYEECLRQRT